MTRKNASQDVWKYIDKKLEDDCWEWVGGLVGKYGQFRMNNKNYLAHRVVYKEVYGSIPNDLCVLHTCDTPSCCNPKHLWLGTQADNMKDRDNKDRNYKGCGENSFHHTLTQIQVETIRYLYSTRQFSQKELGILFNVTQSCISRIISEESWKKI